MQKQAQTNVYMAKLDTVLAEIRDAGGERYKLQPKLQSIITDMSVTGQSIPVQVRKLNAQLQEESFDDLIDNMPV